MNKKINDTGMGMLLRTAITMLIARQETARHNRKEQY